MNEPERKLANAIIQQAVEEFLKDGKKGRINYACLDFLIGKTDIAKFWFCVAGKQYFKRGALWEQIAE